MQAFADYCANLVRYYNKGGFTCGRNYLRFTQSATSDYVVGHLQRIQHQNINGMTASQYIQLCNAVVPAMLRRLSSLGYREANVVKPLNLGLFTVDDGGASRWVLTVKRPAVLSHIDAVFVTVEPPGGSTAPRGKRVLYANLVGPPNHPGRQIP